MSRIIIEGDEKQIALLLQYAESIADLDIVEHIPDAAEPNVDGALSPLYWLDQIRNRGGLTYTIENPSEWQREIRRLDKTLYGRD
jgi:hypothetical protein